MNHLDTFSGIGGWALAAKWMGWNTLAFVEKEKFCHKVLNKNFPGVPIHDDIFTFSGKPFHGRVDVLTGSTPCQPFSQAGKRKGSNDERHLFPEFLRVVAEVEPRWIIIENVYGLLSIESGQVFEDYHASLENEGYSVQTVCIPSSALNAPHRRDRLWMVAHSNTDNTRIGTSTSRPDAKRQLGVERQQSQLELGRHATAHALDGEHRANGRPQSETDSVQGVSGAKGLSGRIGGTDGDVADTDTGGCIGRQEQSEIREWQSDQGRGNDKPFSELAVNNGSNAVGVPRNSNIDGLPIGGHESEHEKIFSKNRASDADLIRHAEGSGQQGSVDGSREAQYGRTGTGLLGFDNDWVSVAARFCRVDDVVPNRVDRLKSLGNAIVPSIAYELLNAIAETEAKGCLE